MAVDTTNMSSTEAFFWTELDQLGITMKGYLRRVSPNSQNKDYVFEMTYPSGEKKEGSVPLDVNTFPAILAIAKGDK